MKNNFEFYEEELLKQAKDNSCKDLCVYDLIREWHIPRVNKNALCDFIEWGYSKMKYKLTSYEKASLEYVEREYNAEKIYRDIEGEIILYDANGDFFNVDFFSPMFEFIRNEQMIEIRQILNNCEIINE